MRIPYVRGAAARLHHGVAQAPSVLRGFSGPGLSRHIERGAFAEREILAWRPFGFGSRMGELLNAKRLATALGARFVFHWPAEALFDVDAVDAVFAPDFVAAHHLPTLEIEQFGSLSTTIAPSDLRDLATGPRRGARMAERYEVRFAGRGLRLPPFSEAFSQVRFHPRLEAIRDAVADLPVVPLAIHLRRPDLSAPEMWYGGRFSRKQVPLTLVERIIAGLPRTDRDRVLLLGNDEALTAAAAHRIGAMTAGAMLPIDERRPLEVAFRDFCLLARSRAVLGGESAFARVTQLVADSQVIRADELLSVDEIRSLLWSAATQSEGPDPLEAALASDHLFQRRELRLTDSEQIELLERTVALIPEDPTRWLGLLLRRARSGDGAGAARTMEAMAARFAGREEVALRMAWSGKTSEASPGHLTAADWRALHSLEALSPPWREVVRSISDGTFAV